MALEKVFQNRLLGVDCQIPARIVDREMCHLIMKINQYLKDGAYEIAKCVLMEFLYLLNQINELLTVPVAADQHIYDVLLYINKHLDTELTLEASTNADFNNYAHFYRMYRREFGISLRLG